MCQSRNIHEIFFLLERVLFLRFFLRFELFCSFYRTTFRSIDSMLVYVTIAYVNFNSLDIWTRPMDISDSKVKMLDIASIYLQSGMSIFRCLVVRNEYVQKQKSKLTNRVIHFYFGFPFLETIYSGHSPATVFFLLFSRAALETTRLYSPYVAMGECPRQAQRQRKKSPTETIVYKKAIAPWVSNPRIMNSGNDCQKTLTTSSCVYNVSLTFHTSQVLAERDSSAIVSFIY